MEAFSFGSYYAGHSFIHRLDPRTKLLAGFGFLFIALASHTFPALAVLAIGVGISYALARIPAHYAVRSVAPLMVLVAFVAILTLFTEQGKRVYVNSIIKGNGLNSIAFALSIGEDQVTQPSRHGPSALTEYKVPVDWSVEP